jgi:hypothetical protein
VERVGESGRGHQFDPSAVSAGFGRLDVLVNDFAGCVWDRLWDGSSWTWSASGMCGWYPPAGVQTGNFVSAFIHRYNDTHILGSLNYFSGDWFTPQSSGDDFNREGSPHAVYISGDLDDIFWLDADGRIKHQQW